MAHCGAVPPETLSTVCLELAHSLHVNPQSTTTATRGARPGNDEPVGVSSMTNHGGSDADDANTAAAHNADRGDHDTQHATTTARRTSIGVVLLSVAVVDVCLHNTDYDATPFVELLGVLCRVTHRRPDIRRRGSSGRYGSLLESLDRQIRTIASRCNRSTCEAIEGLQPTTKHRSGRLVSVAFLD